MDINTLQAFLAVADTASFSGAAERLFLTQPAVSKRVAALESELGTPLFDRIGRTVGLTEAGRALLPRARTILDQLAESRRAIANLSGRVAGPLNIATSHHIGLHRLPPLLRAFNGRHPQVELNIRFLDSEEACRLVELGELELGVITLPLHPPPRLITETVWDDPLAIVCGSGHPLARLPHPTLADLLARPAILPAPGTFTRAVVEEAFAAAPLPLRVSMETNYLETIKMLVAVGLGWSVLPHTMLDAELKVLTVDHLQLHRALGLVRHPERTLSNAARAFADLLRESKAAGDT